MITRLPAATLLVLCTATAMAQTLTDANSIPAVGHNELRSYHSSFSATEWSISGTGNTWDATAVEPFGIDAMVNYRAPGDSPFAAAYPGTTLCAERVQDGNTEWRHYLVDNAHAEMIGISGEDFSGGRTYCTFPFSMGSTFSDDWMINGNTYSDTYTYVASGEVIAPWGTIPDVVMFETSGGFSYTLYLADNLLDPIGTYTPGFGIDLWKVELATGISGTPELLITLRPNPVVDELVLDLADAHPHTVSLHDARGCLVGSWTTTRTRTVLDLRDQAPGVYHLQVLDPRGGSAQRAVLVAR
jgi:hypothetical protein